MKIILLALISVVSLNAFSENGVKPIINGSGQQQQSGPKKPIVSKPPPPPAPPAPKPEPPPPKPTHYELYWEAMNRYSNGRDVKWSEIKGSYVGQCMETPLFSRPERQDVILTYLGTSTNFPDVLIHSGFSERVSFSDWERVVYWVNYARSTYDPHPSWMRSDYRPPKSKYSQSYTFTETVFGANGGDAVGTETFRLSNNELISIRTSLKVSNIGIRGTTLYETVLPGQIWKVCHYKLKVTE